MIKLLIFRTCSFNVFYAGCHILSAGRPLQSISLQKWHHTKRSFTKQVEKLTLHCPSYFSSILGRITRIHQEAIEQRQRMLHLSSTNTPSYASVATRNTTAQTSAARSIIDTNTNSSKSGQNAVAKSCCNALDNQSYSTRVSNSKNTSTSRSDGDGDLGRDTKKTSIGRNSQNDVNWTTSNQQKPKRERQNCSDSTYSLPRETKERTHHSPHSLQRSPVPNGMTGPCGLRNNKTVKSIKYVLQSKKQRRRFRRKSVTLSSLLWTILNLHAGLSQVDENAFKQCSFCGGIFYTEIEISPGMPYFFSIDQ